MSECSVQALKWGATWPSREQFHELADQGYRVIPIVRRLLADSLTPVGFYERLAAGRSGTFILESAEFGGTWNRYSFIGVNSMAQLRSNNGKADWLGQVPAGVPTEGDVMEVAHAALKTLKAPHVEGLPNLTSGLVGTVGWDAIRHWGTDLACRGAERDRAAGNSSGIGHGYCCGRPCVRIGMDDRQCGECRRSIHPCRCGI